MYLIQQELSDKELADHCFFEALERREKRQGRIFNLTGELRR